MILLLATVFVFGFYHVIENQKLNKKLKEFEKELTVRKKI